MVKKKKKKLSNYAGGGNLGSKIADSFKIAGDTLLSTVGASDVIGDDAYRNQSFADASRVGEQIGLGAGQLVGSAFGMGQAVKLGQQAIGAIDGTDQDRLRMEQLRANPQAAGRYAQSISQMNNAIMPLAGGIGAASQIGAGVMGGGSGGLGDLKNSLMGSQGANSLFGNSAMMENFQIGQQGDKAFRAFGGNLPKYPDGGVHPSNREQVYEGSDRYLALQQQQQNLDAFSKRQQEFSPLTKAWGEPFKMSLSDFSSKYPDIDISNVPKGTSSVYQYTSNNQIEDPTAGKVAPIYASKGSNENQTYNFYTGTDNPGAVPEYDIIPKDRVEQITGDVNKYKSGNAKQTNLGALTFDGTTNEPISYVPSGDFDPNRDRLNSGYGPNTDFINKSLKNQQSPSSLDTMSSSGTSNPYSVSLGGLDTSGTTNQFEAERLRSQQLDSFAMGGKINSYDNENKFVEYNGPSHAGGGIKVNAQGLPTNNEATAEVEGGETMMDNGIENYIFSDRLVINPGDKKKLTYADVSKKINNKYKNSETDKIADDTRKLELESLKQEQEEFKATMGSNDLGDSFAIGGKMKYDDGGLLPLKPRKEQPFVLNNNTGLSLLSERPEEVFKLNKDLSTETNNIIKPNQLLQDKINPAGYFASNIGNLNDLIESSQPTAANDFGRMNPNLVDLEAQRKELEKQAGVSRAVSRENARSSGGAGAAMTNQVISNALINSNLGSGLSQSYMTEANTNAQIKNQAEQVNTQIGMQEKIADQQDDAKRKSVTSKALHSIGMNTQGYVKDLTSAKVGNMNNEMWFELVRKGKHTEFITTSEGKPMQVVKDDEGQFYNMSREKVDSSGTVIK